MEKMEIYNKYKSVPEEAKKGITAGRLKGMTDINPMWRVKALTELFGPCGIGWYYIPVKKWTETSGGEVAAFVDIELYVKDGTDWSKPICGTGGSKFVSKEKNGLYVSDECYKMATTDAISVACKQLGIGADVYWASGVTKYTAKEEDRNYGNKKDEKSKSQRRGTTQSNHQEASKMEGQNAVLPELANEQQKEFLKDYCKNKGLNLERLLIFNNVTMDSLTSEQALNLYSGLIERYGE